MTVRTDFIHPRPNTRVVQTGCSPWLIAPALLIGFIGGMLFAGAIWFLEVAR